MEKILTGSLDANIEFADLCALLHDLDFSDRIRGDHHIFWKQGVSEIINLQPKGSKSKPYQVRQVRDILKKYDIGVDDG